MNKSMKKINMALVAVTAVILFGCGKQTLQDNLSSEIDRSSENSSLMNKRYQAVEGQYTTDESQDKSPYWITLDVKRSMVQKDGFVTPQPTLSGSITTWDKSYASSVSDAVSKDASAPALGNGMFDTRGVSSSFADGMYDQGTQTMIVKAPSSVAPIQVSCKVKDSNTLFCDYLLNAAQAKSFSFVLARIATRTSLASGK